MKPRSNSRRNCQTAISFIYPDGWSYAVSDASFDRYFFNLEAGVTVTFATAYYTQGGPQTWRASAVVNGPRGDYANVPLVVAASEPAWSPCHARRALNLNEQARLVSTRPNHRGFVMAVDAEDSSGLVQHHYKLIWKRCQ